MVHLIRRLTFSARMLADNYDNCCNMEVVWVIYKAKRHVSESAGRQQRHKNLEYRGLLSRLRQFPSFQAATTFFSSGRHKFPFNNKINVKS